MTKLFHRQSLSNIEKDLKKKMVLLSGPRQTGKTVLAQSLLKNQSRYLNWDYDEDRERILNRKWPLGPGLIVLDEIHKCTEWRNAIKGLYDKRKNEIQILVTGSARLEYYSHGGDSLQGRYFLHRLHPLTVAELKIDSRKDFDDLFNLSGFPEPFFSSSKTERDRWARTYRSLLIKEDLRDLERVADIGKIELLSLRLPELVASPLSLNGLREDLNIAHKTVESWCNILERLFYIFRIYPFGSPKIQAVKKQAKHYHYDWALVPDRGARLENLVAGHLLKWCHHQQDVYGREISLSYFRDLEKREVDFIILENNRPIQAIECKASYKGIDPNLRYFKSKFPKVECIQIELEARDSYQTEEDIKVIPLISFLARLV